MKVKFTGLCKPVFFGVALYCVLLSGGAVADEWSIEPSASLYEEYNDNIRFTSAPHPNVWQTSLRPNVKFSKKTEISEVSGQAQLGINRYAGDPTLNQTDKLLLLFANYLSERNTWSMNTSYRSDTTSEVVTNGLVQPRTQRSALSLNPSWRRSLTEKTSLRLDYQYQNVKYDKATSTDYTYQQVGSTLQYALSERDQVNLSTNYSRLKYVPIYTLYPFNLPYTYGGSDTSVIKSNTLGIQVGVTHLFSETMRGTFSLGRRDTVNSTQHICNGMLGSTSTYTNTFCTGFNGDPMITYTDETHSNGYSLNANLNKQFESGTISGLVSRDVNPSGSGLVQTTQYGLSMSKALTEKLTASLDTSVYRTTFISTTSPGSRYYTFEPRLSWHFSEAWMLDGGYRYARVRYDNNVSSPITANAVYLNLTYSWPKIAISR